MNGSGMPVIGMIPIVIPMFSKIWNMNIASTPTHDERPEEVAGQLRGSPDAPRRCTANSASSVAAADEAELLADRGEDEVGVLLGHVAELGLACP